MCQSVSGQDTSPHAWLGFHSNTQQGRRLCPLALNHNGRVCLAQQGIVFVLFNLICFKKKKKKRKSKYYMACYGHIKQKIQKEEKLRTVNPGYGHISSTKQMYNDVKMSW